MNNEIRIVDLVVCRGQGPSIRSTFPIVAMEDVVTEAGPAVHFTAGEHPSELVSHIPILRSDIVSLFTYKPGEAPTQTNEEAS